MLDTHFLCVFQLPWVESIDPWSMASLSNEQDYVFVKVRCCSCGMADILGKNATTFWQQGWEGQKSQ